MTMQHPLGVSKALSSWRFEPTPKVIARCDSCDKEKVIDCPCGTTKCKLQTEVKACPHCEPAASTRELKFHGVKVCAAVAKRDLGL